MDRGGREPPQRDVLQGPLPALEERRRHATGRSRPVEVRQAPGAVGVGVVGRQARLVDEAGVEVVDAGEGSADLAGEPRSVGHLGEVDGVAREVGIDRGPTAPLERQETLRGRHREAEPPSQEGEQTHRRVELGPGRLRARSPHHPAAVLGVADDGDVEPVVRQARQGLDRHGVETGHGGARDRGQVEGGPFHDPTVCRGAHLEWATWPEQTEPFR